MDDPEDGGHPFGVGIRGWVEGELGEDFAGVAGADDGVRRGGPQPKARLTTR